MIIIASFDQCLDLDFQAKYKIVLLCQFLFQALHLCLESAIFLLESFREAHCENFNWWLRVGYVGSGIGLFDVIGYVPKQHLVWNTKNKTQKL